MKSASRMGWSSKRSSNGAFESAGEAVVEVRDHGKGIPTEEIGGLFHLYQKTSVRPTGGEQSLVLPLRAIDSAGATIDFLLSALRDVAATKRLFRRTLSDPSHPQPRVINTDKARLYCSAIADLKAEGTLHRRCRHRPVQYLNNLLEQDHRAIKRRVMAKQSFRAFDATRRTLAGLFSGDDQQSHLEELKMSFEL